MDPGNQILAMYVIQMKVSPQFFDLILTSYSLTLMSDTKHTLSVSTIVIISSVLSSFIFFFIGLLCGQITRLFLTRKKQSSENSQDYEVVPYIANSKEPHKTVTLQPNEAYGQVCIHS